MLTEEEVYKNKEKYLGLLNRVIKEDAFNNLCEYLTTINFFDAPATAQYERSYRGGLCEQSLKLAHELGVLCTTYFPGKYTEEDILKVALLKETYRAIMYEPYVKNVKNDETGKWEAIGAFRTKDNRPVYGDLGFSSYMILKEYISFSTEQIEAIIHTTGLNNYSVDSHEVLKSYPLVTLTKMADLAITNF